jgi:hypothetical protein
LHFTFALHTVEPRVERLRARRARRGGASRRNCIGGEARGSVSTRLADDGSEKHERRVTSSKQASVSVALYRRPPRSSRASSASGHVEHAAKVVFDVVASAAKRGEVFPLSPLQRWQRKAHERRVTHSNYTATKQQWLCCTLPPLSTLEPRVERLRARRARRGGAPQHGVASAVRRGETSPRLSNDGSSKQASEWLLRFAAALHARAATAAPQDASITAWRRSPTRWHRARSSPKIFFALNSMERVAVNDFLRMTAIRPAERAKRWAGAWPEAKRTAHPFSPVLLTAGRDCISMTPTSTPNYRETEPRAA